MAGDHNDTVHLPAQENAGDTAISGRILAGIAEDDAVAVLARLFFNAARTVAVKGIVISETTTPIILLSRVLRLPPHWVCNPALQWPDRPWR